MIKRTIKIPMGAPIGPEQKPIYGYLEIEAYCQDGLAVHKALKWSKWKWTITQESSGLKLERIGAMTKARAIENMQLALALPFNWKLPEKETLDALRQSRGIIDAISNIGMRA